MNLFVLIPKSTHRQLIISKMRIEEALKQIPDTQQLRIAEIVENIAVIIKEEKISSSGSQ